MTKTSFTSLSTVSLRTAVGGYHDPGGSTGSTSSKTAAPDDYGSKYVATLQKDGKDYLARQHLLADALSAHKWGNAAKQYGYSVLDELGMAGDALSPILGGGVKAK